LGIRATWNCVGLIGTAYPDTLGELVASGQELASHTFHHLDVTTLSRTQVADELARCRLLFHDRFKAEVVGLHPPCDRWSMTLPGILKEQGYRYLIARHEDPRHWHAHDLAYPLSGPVLCIPSVADDWGYIANRWTAHDMQRYWLDRLAMVSAGSVVALGVHPWVLGQHTERFRGLERFLQELTGCGRYVLVTAREVADWYAR